MTNITSLATIREGSHQIVEEQKRLPRILLAGRMQAIAADGDNFLPKSRKGRALFSYVCLAGGEPVSRNRLAGIIWDRSADIQARMSLRQALVEINTHVNAKCNGLIEIDRELVRVNRKLCWIDVFDDGEPEGQLLDGLDGISAGFDHWLASERARFEDRLRATLEAELSRLTAEHASPEARAATARRLLNFDPTHEGAVRSLMTAFAQMGERAQAIREYERCRQALRTELDLSPSSETTALYEAVRLSQPRGFRPNCGEQGAADNGDLDKPSPGSVTAKEGSRPSIAVLPFRNLSADPRHDYTADGLVEDLTEVLSHIPTFFVVSRLSTLTFKKQDRLPQEIGQLLGVRYVLSGSMRILETRLRLTVELTDARSGVVLWSSKLDEQFFDLLEVQQRLADAIVARVAPYLYAEELKRARLKRPDRSDAYELFLRAQESMHNSSRAVFETSEALFDDAINRDPGYAHALAWRAYWHVLRVGQGWSSDPVYDVKQADHFAQRAVECDALEPMALAVQGHIASYLHKNFELAFRLFDTALTANPNAAPAWLWSAAAHSWIGEGPKAVAKIDRAISLSPFDPLMYAYTSVAGMSYLADGQPERAIEYAQRSIALNKTYTASYKLLVLALMLAGRQPEAEGCIRQLLDLEPGLTVAEYRSRFPGSAHPIGQLYAETLARAGLPPDMPPGSIRQAGNPANVPVRTYAAAD